MLTPQALCAVARIEEMEVEWNRASKTNREKTEFEPLEAKLRALDNKSWLLIELQNQTTRRYCVLCGAVYILGKINPSGKTRHPREPTHISTVLRPSRLPL